MILYVSWMGKENGDRTRIDTWSSRIHSTVLRRFGISDIGGAYSPLPFFQLALDKLDLIFPRPTVDIMSTTANPNVMALGESHDEMSHV